MKNILLHCAMEKEACNIAKKLSLVQKYKNNILTVYKGKINNSDIDLIVTGIGKQKTAIGLTYYLENNQKPDIIINIGYAGSTNTNIGEWINITKSYNLEWDILGEEKYSMDIGNIELEKMDELEGLPCYSAECFVTKTDITGNVIFDMELHSICLIADIYKIPVLSLKKVSDNLNLDDYYKNIETKQVMELESGIKYIEKYID